MNRTARVLGALALATAGLGLAPASQASDPTPEPIVTSLDPRGDIKLRGDRYLTARQKRSVDIHRVTLSRVGNKARITITMRQVIRVRKFDQMFFVKMVEHPDTPGGARVADAGFTSRGRLSYSSYADSDWKNYETCGVEVVARPRRRQLVATIPSRCTPRAPVNVRVTSMTGFFRTDGPIYSRDGHRVRGWHDFRP